MTVGGLLVGLLIPICTASYIESVAANVDSSSTRKHEKFVPLVAFECGYRNQYIDESGFWVTDESRYATCQSGKLDILKYCKKVYPKLNITNIVEYAHEVDISRWCKEEGTPCSYRKTVRPFQCIDGEFRSEALQVPHDCRFSHVNSKNSCNDYQHWRDESKRICSRKEFDGKPMAVRSFAVLEPCGLDLFTGVEFVCCPAATVKQDTVEKAVSKMDKAAKKLTEEVDDDDYEDDYTESDEDDDESEEKKVDLTQDPYFKKVDYQHEHENFKDALDRLEKIHRVKIENVMKEWTELETRYNEMKNKDPKGAEGFKASMTNRFQKTVASLEEEHKKLKKDLDDVHEERVQSSYNEKKRNATHQYRAALTKHVEHPNKGNVLKTLKMYIRAEEKDRMHTLNKYRHLLRTDQDEARAYRETVLHKLRYIDLRINGTLAMMRDFPDLDSQVRPIAVAYWVDVRRENTPELSDAAIDGLNSLDSEAKNKRLVDLYKESYEKLHPNTKLDVRAPDPTAAPALTTTTGTQTDDDSEEDSDDYYEDEDDEEVRKVTKKPSIKVIDIKVKKAEVKEDENEIKELPAAKIEKAEKAAPKIVETADKSTQTDDDDSSSESDEDDDADEEQVKELKVDIEPIIEEKPAFYKNERLFQNHGNHIARGATSQALLLFGAVFVLSACVMIVSLYRRRRNHHGFIEVDVYTPEERHVAGMQVNGYENPTYSFFDSKA